MLLAHTFGATGPDVEFLLLAVAMFVLGVIFFFQKTVKPMVSVVLVLMSFAAAAGAFAMSGEGGEGGEAISTDATIAIVSPVAGDEVPAGEVIPIDVEVTDGEITTDTTTDDPSKGHLHVYVDGQLASMPMGDAAEVSFPEPGTYELTVEFTRADHRSFEPPVLSTIEITAT